MRTRLVLFFCLILVGGVNAQDSTITRRMTSVFFPTPMNNHKWGYSLGFVATTTPEDITEEARVRAPAGDWHVLRKLNSHFNLDGRVLFQVVQNHFSVGLKWSSKLYKNIYISAGDDVAFWFGKLEVAGFDSKGRGWMNYPNISIGLKTGHDLLFTFKTEAMFNTSYTFYNGGYEITKDDNFFNGFAYTFALEQPFFGKQHLSLAFTAMYTNFFWETWSLFETFDRNIFYPQVTVGFII